MALTPACWNIQNCFYAFCQLLSQNLFNPLCAKPTGYTGLLGKDSTLLEGEIFLSNVNRMRRNLAPLHFNIL